MKMMRLMRVVLGLSLGLTLISNNSLAQTSITSAIPLVTIRATDPYAGPGNPGVFTVFRAGNPLPSLSVKTPGLPGPA